MDPVSKQIISQQLRQMAVEARQKANDDPLMKTAQLLEDICLKLAVADGWLDEANYAEQRRKTAVAAAAQADERLAALQADIATAEETLDALRAEIARFDDIKKDKRIRAMVENHLE